MLPGWPQAVTGDGYDAILSAPWYLNLGCYASDDWKKYYAGAAVGCGEVAHCCGVVRSSATSAAAESEGLREGANSCS